jgi:ketosteroid isomerase-like protein
MTSRVLVVIGLSIGVSLGSCQQHQSNAYNEKEIIDSVTATVNRLSELTVQKNIDQLMTLYADSKEFQYIDNEGTPKDLDELREIYSNLFQSLDYIELLENHVDVVPVNEETAYCIWKGKEEIKMLESEKMLSSWIATIILRKIDDNWKIVHFHSTHF